MNEMSVYFILRKLFISITYLSIILIFGACLEHKNKVYIASNENVVNLAWDPFSDLGRGIVSDYDIYRNGAKKTGNITATSFTNLILVAGETYTYQGDDAPLRSKSPKSNIAKGAILNGQIYYVSSSMGDDANDGMSEGKAWRSLRHVNGKTFNPGDSVLFRRNDEWRERLVVPSSGTESQPIRFGAYSTGRRPLFSTLYDLVNEEGHQWTLYSTSTTGTKKVWQMKWKSCSNSTNYNRRVPSIDEGNGLQRLHNRGEHTVNKDYSWKSVNGCFRFLFRYDAGNPGQLGVKFYAAKVGTEGNFNGTSGVANLIETNGKDYLIIEDLRVRGAVVAPPKSSIQPSGIFVNGSSHTIIRNIESSFNWQGVGIMNKGVTPSTYNVLEGLDVHHNQGAAIYLRKGTSSHNTISNSLVHHNYDRQGDVAVGDKLAIGCTGLKRTGGDRTGNKVIGNTLYENGDWNNSSNGLGVLDPAIGIYSCANTLVQHNLIMNNDQAAFYFAQGSKNSEFSSNIVIGNESRNFHMTRMQISPSSRFISNLIVKNKLTQTKAEAFSSNYAFFINDGSPNATVLNNIFAENIGASTVANATNAVRIIHIQGLTNTVDYNLYYGNSTHNYVNAVADQFANKKHQPFANFNAWNKKSGYDKKGLSSDPQLLLSNIDNPSTFRVNLSSKSPVINAGINVLLIKDIYGNPIQGSPDLGPVEYQLGK